MVFLIQIIKLFDQCLILKLIHILFYKWKQNLTWKLQVAQNLNAHENANKDGTSESPLVFISSDYTSLSKCPAATILANLYRRTIKSYNAISI